MDGKEAIIAKIRAEAETAAAQIRAEAENSLALAVKQAEEQAAAASERRKSATQAECEAIVLRATTLARLECRKQTLERKQELLSEAYAIARQRLLSDEKAYRNFCAAVIKQNARKGELVQVGEEDEKILDEKWLKSVSATLSFAKEKHSGRGVILISDDASKVFTLDVVFALVRERTESKIASILFGDSNK